MQKNWNHNILFVDKKVSLRGHTLREKCGGFGGHTHVTVHGFKRKQRKIDSDLTDAVCTLCVTYYFEIVGIKKLYFCSTNQPEMDVHKPLRF